MPRTSRDPKWWPECGTWDTPGKYPSWWVKPTSWWQRGFPPAGSTSDKERMDDAISECSSVPIEERQRLAKLKYATRYQQAQLLHQKRKVDLPRSYEIPDNTERLCRLRELFGPPDGIRKPVYVPPITKYFDHVATPVSPESIKVVCRCFKWARKLRIIA